MLFDENDRRNARQDLLEAMSAGIAGSAVAPMPGILMEMLEIAAMEHRGVRELPASLQGPAGAQPLTKPQNSSGMITLLTKPGKAIADVASRFRTLLDARRMPV